MKKILTIVLILVSLSNGLAVSAKTASEILKESKAYFRNGNVQAAFKLCNQAIQKDPKISEAYIVRGWLLLHANKPERSIPEFKRALELNPRSVDAYKSLNIVYRLLKQPEASEEEIKKALKIAPEDMEVYYLYAVNLILGGQHRQALLNLDKAVKYGKNHPRLANAYYWRGRCRQMLGMDRGAVEDLTETIRLSEIEAKAQPKHDPKYDLSNMVFKVAESNLPGYENFGMLERSESYMKLGEHKKAARDLCELVKFQPKDDILLEQRGLAYLLAGEHHKALQDFNKALLTGSHSTDLYLRIATCNFCMKRYEKVPGILKTWFKREGYLSQDSSLAIFLAYTSMIRARHFKKAHQFLAEVRPEIPVKNTWDYTCFYVLKKSQCCSKLISFSNQDKKKKFAKVHLFAGLFYSLEKQPVKAMAEFKKVLLTKNLDCIELPIARAEIAIIEASERSSGSKK